MAMTTAGKGMNSDINITPFIDVLLVLLVIFMITQPMLRKVLDIQVPVEEQSEQRQQESTQIILSLHADGTMDINTQPVTRTDLTARLRAIYDVRPDKLIFIKAHDSRRYQEVVDLIDVARGAGVQVFGLAPGDAAVPTSGGGTP